MKPLSHQAVSIELAQNRLRLWLLDTALATENLSVPGAYAVDGTARYAYPEAGGYALVWLADLSMRQPWRRPVLSSKATAIVAWLATLLRTGMPTRVTLGAEPEDWRNCVRFCFDIAVVLRGLVVARAMDLVDSAADSVAAEVNLMLADFITVGGELKTVAARSDHLSPPDRWSTRAGPFLAKPAAAILQASAFVPVSEALIASAHVTLRQASSLPVASIHPENRHAALYAAEGLLIAGTLASETSWTEHATAITRHLAEVLNREGEFAQSNCGGGPQRSDVLAQWLRMARLLDIDPPLRAVTADRLAAVVRGDGSLPFDLSDDDGGTSTWCALFAEQALSLCDTTELRRECIACLV